MLPAASLEGPAVWLAVTWTPSRINCGGPTLVGGAAGWPPDAEPRRSITAKLTTATMAAVAATAATQGSVFRARRRGAGADALGDSTAPLGRVRSGARDAAPSE